MKSELLHKFSFFNFVMFPRKKKYPLVTAQQLLRPLPAGETQAACSAGEHDVCITSGDWKSHLDVEVSSPEK